MDNKVASHLPSGDTVPVDLAVVQQAPREKSKRPQLSCNACRQRKVKCDRVQPCTACSLHQNADLCRYDLTESERHPILQAEALREKDKEIARLRMEVFTLSGSSAGTDFQCNDLDTRKKRKPGTATRSPKKQSNLNQKKAIKQNSVEGIYFGAPGLLSVVGELADLTLRSKVASLSHSPRRRPEDSTTQEVAAHPFPTLWHAKDGIAALVSLIPNREETFSYLSSFQLRAQGHSFPYLPYGCTRVEIENFLANAEHNAMLCPDMLALFFGTLAQGLQHGVYDRSDQQWVAGSREVELKKVAASMQALRLASYMSRPTLLVIEALLMISPYLTDSGRIFDAWALFGTTVRLAQAIELHHDPCHLYPRPPAEEITSRKNLWWWMLHMDQQYSVILGKPLGISSIGDCPAPTLPPKSQNEGSFSTYHSQFSVLARQILTTEYLCNAQIDHFTDQLMLLQDNLPEHLKFREDWLQKDFEIPPWPVNLQAATFHQKIHNLIILLNRQRIEDNGADVIGTTTDCRDSPGTNISRNGRDRVLESCYENLHILQLFKIRLRVGLGCWTTCQQAFNAVAILILEMNEQNTLHHYQIIEQAYETFCEIHHSRIHQLAGDAVERIQTLFSNIGNGSATSHKVMSKQSINLLGFTTVHVLSDNRIDSPGFDNEPTRKLSGNKSGLERVESDVETPRKPCKKQKQSPPSVTTQGARSLNTNLRKEPVPPRQVNNNSWARENSRSIQTDSFANPSVPTHSQNATELSIPHVQSALKVATPNESSHASASESSTQTMSATPATDSSFSMAGTRPWAYSTQPSPTSSTFPAASVASISEPSYHPTSFLQNNLTQFCCSMSAANSRPPSLRLSSQALPSFANSAVSSLQTTSGLCTPNTSYPVSPVLSHSQHYCLSQPQTQPQSPAWGVQFENGMDCTQLAIGLGQGVPASGDVGDGRAWWS